VWPDRIGYFLSLRCAARVLVWPEFVRYSLAFTATVRCQYNTALLQMTRVVCFSGGQQVSPSVTMGINILNGSSAHFDDSWPNLWEPNEQSSNSSRISTLSPSSFDGNSIWLQFYFQKKRLWVHMLPLSQNIFFFKC
jgi:hypothetical protein